MRTCFEQLSSRGHSCLRQLASNPSSGRHYSPTASIFCNASSTRFPTRTIQTRSLFQSQNPPHHVTKIVQPFQRNHSAVRGYGRGPKRSKKRAAKTQPIPSAGDWVTQVEQHLPQNLRLINTVEQRIAASNGADFGDILSVLMRARDEGKTNVLAFMVLDQDRHKAVIYIVDLLLRQVALVVNEPFKDKLPSNIKWPDSSFDIEFGRPIELESTTNISPRPRDPDFESFDHASLGNHEDEAMMLVWLALAEMVLAGSKQPTEKAKQTMNTVYQILALIHRLGLVPGSIYTQNRSQGATHVQQPPVLHFLSTKILSTLSDAVWHAYRDEVSAQSTNGQKSPWNIFPEPPGSPLRIRGRELGPEVWIEFILWCCVEAGLASTAADIFSLLGDDKEDPWHVVPWSGIRLPAVRARQIGTLDERSTRKFLHDDELLYPADGSHKMISAEVVLAAADSLVNTLCHDSESPKLSSKQVQVWLRDLLTLVGTHNLPLGYLDYITVRLLQNGRGGDIGLLTRWARMVRRLRTTELDNFPLNPSQLVLESIVVCSELQAGVFHQGLQACIEGSLVRKTVDDFTELQRMIDENKLRTIGEFLSLPLAPQAGFFTSRPGKTQMELLNSYGQLPFYKLTPLLDMITYAKLFGLGDWLLYSDDVDGATLPANRWGQPSIAAALARYASAKGDRKLFDQIVSLSGGTKRKLPTKLLRALVVGSIDLRQWDQARTFLSELRETDGGDVSPGMVAGLAAAILRMEVDTKTRSQAAGHADLTEAQVLFLIMLDTAGAFPLATFRVDQKKTFKQQVGYLIRILQNIRDTSLVELTHGFSSKFPTSNEPYLARNTFNVLFDAIVESRGALEGMSIWHMFCADPRDDKNYADLLDHDEEADISFDQVESNEDAECVADDEIGHADTEQRLPLSHTEHRPDEGGIPSSSPTARAGVSGPTPLAYPASPNVESDWQQEPFDFSVARATEISDVKAPGEDVFINDGSDSRDPIVTPVVVPDVRTLQILVGGAVQKIKSRGTRHQSTSDLEGVIGWARQFREAFKLTATTYMDELLHPPSMLPERLRRGVTYRGIEEVKATVQATYERARPKVSAQFARGAFKSRSPGVARAPDQTARISGWWSEDEAVKSNVTVDGTGLPDVDSTDGSLGHQQ